MTHAEVEMTTIEAEKMLERIWLANETEFLRVARMHAGVAAMRISATPDGTLVYEPITAEQLYFTADTPDSRATPDQHR
jgi:hypothetical protein